jgi:hypothetical protein
MRVVLTLDGVPLFDSGNQNHADSAVKALAVFYAGLDDDEQAQFFRRSRTNDARVGRVQARSPGGIHRAAHRDVRVYRRGRAGVSESGLRNVARGDQCGAATAECAGGGAGFVMTESAERLARRIARDLFTDGAGHRAGRLVFEYPNGQRIEGTGWSEKAFADRIARLMKATTRRKKVPRA